LIDIERLSDQELDEMQATYEKFKDAWNERQVLRSINPAADKDLR